MRKRIQDGITGSADQGSLAVPRNKKGRPPVPVGATCEIFIRVIDATVGRIHNDQMGINLWDI
jgi:hypothetical protein